MTLVYHLYQSIQYGSYDKMVFDLVDINIMTMEFMTNSGLSLGLIYQLWSKKIWCIKMVYHYGYLLWLTLRIKREKNRLFDDSDCCDYYTDETPRE